MGLCSRHLFETTARKELCQEPGVEFVYGVSVTGLEFSGTAAAAAAGRQVHGAAEVAVTAAAAADAHAENQTASTHSKVVTGVLKVHATWRACCALQWLLYSITPVDTPVFVAVICVDMSTHDGPVNQACDHACVCRGHLCWCELT
jgi:hypothetical protein